MAKRMLYVIEIYQHVCTFRISFGA